MTKRGHLPGPGAAGPAPFQSQFVTPYYSFMPSCAPRPCYDGRQRPSTEKSGIEDDFLAISIARGLRRVCALKCCNLLEKSSFFYSPKFRLADMAILALIILVIWRNQTSKSQKASRRFDARLAGRLRYAGCLPSGQSGDRAPGSGPLLASSNID